MDLSTFFPEARLFLAEDPVQLFLGRAERLVVLYDWILGLENAGRE